MDAADIMASSGVFTPGRTPVPESPPQPFGHNCSRTRKELWPSSSVSSGPRDDDADGWADGLRVHSRSQSSSLHLSRSVLQPHLSAVSSLDLEPELIVRQRCDETSTEPCSARMPPSLPTPTPCPPGPPDSPSECDLEVDRTSPLNAPYGDETRGVDVSDLQGTLAEVDRIHGLLRSSIGRLADDAPNETIRAPHIRTLAHGEKHVQRNHVAPVLTQRPAGAHIPLPMYRPFEDVTSDRARSGRQSDITGRLSSESWVFPRRSTDSNGGEEPVLPLVVDTSLQKKLDAVTAERDALREAALASSSELRKAQHALASAVKALTPQGAVQAQRRSQSSTRTRAGRASGSGSPEFAGVDRATRRSSSASGPYSADVQRPHPHPRMKHLMQYNEPYLQREPVVVGMQPTWTQAAIVARRSRAPSLPKRVSVSHSQTRQNGASTIGLVRSVSPPARIPVAEDTAPRKALGALDPNAKQARIDAKRKPTANQLKAVRPRPVAVFTEHVENTNESLVVHPTMTRQVKTYPKPTISSQAKRERPRPKLVMNKAMQRSNSNIHAGNGHRKLVF